jgi:hypothetical protein
MNANRQHRAFERELAWALIFVLLSLYVVTSYLYWAKTASAWPIFH